MRVRNLKKSFGKVRAVDGVDIDVKRGRCLGLLGPNGAGKTTTVEMLEGLNRPDAGEILYKGQPLSSTLREEAGIMFQSTALQEHITVFEALRMFQRFYQRSRSLADIIQEFSLEPLLQRDTRKLSGGQRQRLLFAIAMLNDPEILFLDEPSTGLDPQARRNIWERIHVAKAHGKTIVLTTHYMDEAHALCDDLAIMDHGKVIAQGTPNALLSQHFNDVVIELPGKAERDWEKKIQTGTVVQLRDRVEILSEDVNATLHELLQADISFEGIRIRSRNLEDLFLALTGKALRQ